MARINLREFAAAQETTPGTAETLASGDLLVRAREGDVWQQVSELFETGEVQASSSMRPQLPGVDSVDATMSYVLRVPTSGTPVIGPMLESAMLEETASGAFICGSVTGGPFVVGETVTGTTSSATGKIRKTIASGGGTMFVNTVSGGPFVAELLTGSTSSATCTSTSVGTAYQPTDSNFGGGDSKHHVTGGFNQDGLHMVSRGMLSNVQFQFDVARPVIVTQRFVGGFEEVVDKSLFDPSSYPEEDNTASRFEAITLLIDGYAATDIRSMTLTIETNPEIRQDAQNANGGVLYADYQKIMPTITLDPAQASVATYAFHAKYKAGTTFEVSWDVGTGAGNIWRFIAPVAQFTSLEMGAERNLATIPIEIGCAGTNNDEIFIAQL